MRLGLPRRVRLQSVSVSLSGPRVVQSTDICSRKILALEQERLATDRRPCIGETVAEVERSGVTPLSVAPPGTLRCIELFGVDRDKLGADLEQPEIELAPAGV